MWKWGVKIFEVLLGLVILAGFKKSILKPRVENNESMVMENRKWFSKEGADISPDTLRHLHREIRLERAFWHDKTVAYLKWYATFIFALYSGAFLLVTKADLGPFFILITVIPLFGILLCDYAKRSMRVCYKQFLEHTTIMAKLDYLLGLYVPIKSEMSDAKIFSKDLFLNPSRHFKFLETNETAEKYVDDELKAKERTYAYKRHIFTVIQWISLGVSVVFFVVGLFEVSKFLRINSISSFSQFWAWIIKSLQIH
jgi:hypothetical protein